LDFGIVINNIHLKIIMSMNFVILSCRWKILNETCQLAYQLR